MKYKAFLFDLNGTMIDDMAYHVKAWHGIVNKFGANLSSEEVEKECYGKNEEVLERILPGRFTLEEKRKIGFEKEKQYQSDFKPQLALINGLDTFLKKSFDAGTRLAIGSAAIPYNIDFVLDGLGIRKYFSAIVSADDVVHSKPDPETYLKCSEKLNTAPKDCLVFEDAPKGVETAANAGMDCVAITTMHEEKEFRAFSNIVRVIKDYNQLEI